MKLSAIFATVGGVAFASAGGLATAAIVSSSSSAPPPTKTVTVNLSPGPPGPQGPKGDTGPQGPQGPAGGFECLTGYSPGILVINQPGGHVKVYTCIEGP